MQHKLAVYFRDLLHYLDIQLITVPFLEKKDFRLNSCNPNAPKYMQYLPHLQVLAH